MKTTRIYFKIKNSRMIHINKIFLEPQSGPLPTQYHISHEFINRKLLKVKPQNFTTKKKEYCPANFLWIYIIWFWGWGGENSLISESGGRQRRTRQNQHVTFEYQKLRSVPLKPLSIYGMQSEWSMMKSVQILSGSRMPLTLNYLS